MLRSPRPDDLEATIPAQSPPSPRPSRNYISAHWSRLFYPPPACPLSPPPPTQQRPLPHPPRAVEDGADALQSQRDNADIAALDQRVRDAQAAVDRATNALQPDPQAVAQADANANTAKAKLSQLQADPTKANDKPTMDAARADVTRADAAAASARPPTGSQAALDNARRDLQDAQQARLFARLS